MIAISRHIRSSLYTIACLAWVACGNNASSPTSDSAVQTVVDAPPRSNADAATNASGWLHTNGNKILTSDNEVWRGRGANMHDTRGCNACTWSAPNPSEVNRRIDELVDGWGANFLRLTLESYATADGRTHFVGAQDDAAYLADIVSIVNHIGTKPGVYVMVSLWIDPSFTQQGWPTTQTADVWRLLAQTFRNDSHVLFGLVNEPQSNFDGANDAMVWQAMNDTVAAIRQVEDSAGTPRHIVAVQGTRAWARRLDYYVDNPIQAGGGENVAYETHVYDAAADFDVLFVTPSATLPVIIGEFGPAASMTMADCDALMTRARALDVPHLAWTFHGRCAPNLIVDNSGGGCGVDMELQPTAWGQLLQQHLAIPW